MHFSLRKKLIFNYTLALGSLVILTVASYWIVQSSLEKKKDDARVLNISGKQEMLCQKMVKTVLQLRLSQSPSRQKAFQESLKETLIEWELFYNGLKNGDSNLGLPGNNPEPVILLFKRIDPHYQNLTRSAQAITQLSLLQEGDSLAYYASIMLEADEPFDMIMDDITLEYDRTVSKRLQRIGQIELYILLLTLLALLLITLGIFRPTLGMIFSYLAEIDRSKITLENLNANLQKSEEEIRHKNEEISASEEEIRQNMEELEAINENLIKTSEELRQKNEILREATEVLDLKNRQIRSNRDQLYEQSLMMKEQNTNITKSLRYAKRIQDAIIPEPEQFRQLFAQSFILAIPRDIVSGDFYWFAQHGSRKVIIAGDCTGHGVPGALMTMIGNSLLNQIITGQGLTRPDQILLELDKKLSETLQKRSNNGKAIHDGMDMAVITVDEERNVLEFAAAHNPLFQIRNGELNRVKGSRFPVGSSQYKEDKVFDLHEIEIQSGDTYYIFSDGFQDQYNQKEKRKYMTKRFRNFISEISPLPMTEQKMALSEELKEWKGNGPQTDDVLVLGIRF